MRDAELNVYAKLYNITLANMEAAGLEVETDRTEFMEVLGRAPDEIHGIKAHLEYYVLFLTKNRFIQNLIRKLPKRILDIGRKLVG